MYEPTSEKNFSNWLNACPKQLAQKNSQKEILQTKMLNKPNTEIVMRWNK